MSAVAPRPRDKDLLVHHIKVSPRTKGSPNIIPSLANKLQNIDDFSLESIKVSILLDSERAKFQSTPKLTSVPSAKGGRKSGFFSNSEIKKQNSSFDRKTQDKKDIRKALAKRRAVVGPQTPVALRSGSTKSRSTTLTPRKQVESKFFGDSETKNSRVSTVEDSARTHRLLLALVNKEDEVKPVKKATQKIQDRTLSKEKGRKKSQKKETKMGLDVFAKLSSLYPLKKIPGESGLIKGPDERKKKNFGIYSKRGSKASLDTRIRNIPSLNLDDLSGEARIYHAPATTLANSNWPFSNPKLGMVKNSRASPISFIEQIRGQSQQRGDSMDVNSRMRSLRSIYASQKVDQVIDNTQQNKKPRLRRKPMNVSNKNVSHNTGSLNEISSSIGRPTSLEKAFPNGRTLKRRTPQTNNISQETTANETLKRGRATPMKQGLVCLLERYKRVLKDQSGSKKELIEKTKKILEKMKELSLK